LMEVPTTSQTLKQGDANRAVYVRRSVVSCYDRDTLHGAEAIILLKYREHVWNKRVLDLGCGGGRTSSVLHHCASHFVGVDYSAAMIEACRQRFPGADFREGDVRNLVPFPNDAFDLVFFSFNGLDTIDHNDRMQAFKEVRRVLKPGCLFLFSSHNRNYELAAAPPRLTFVRNPVTQLRLIQHYWNCRRNRMKNAPRERSEDEYAIINDLAHEYSLLHYYITKEQQALQLARCGFELLEMRDIVGNEMAADAYDRDVPWIHYVARKPLDRG